MHHILHEKLTILCILLSIHFLFVNCFSENLNNNRKIVCIGLRKCFASRNDNGLNKSDDFSSTFNYFEWLLFNTFSGSVHREMKSVSTPKLYTELISTISLMVGSSSTSIAQQRGKNVLVNLFPAWLLSEYKKLFSKPFPDLSAVMNTWVTHWTTRWLMGNSTVYDLELPDGSIKPSQGLLVEKCRFLEESGCLAVCINACKIPTQRFFLEEMGLPVTLSPNVTDMSCRFEFGKMPLPLEVDPISALPCLSTCRETKRKRLAVISSLRSTSTTGSSTVGCDNL